MNKNLIIEVYPVCEEDWWSDGEERDISILPKLTKWNLPAPSCGWFDKDRVASSWPWWKTVTNDLPLFINYATGIIGIDSSQEYKADNFLLSMYSKEIEEVTFNIVVPPEKWKLEHVSFGFLCNITQRKTEPEMNIVDEWLSMGDDRGDKIFKIQKELMEKEGVINKNGTWKFTYLPTGSEIFFDSHFSTKYGDIKIMVGIKEKENPETSAIVIRKKLSLVEALTIPSRKEWKDRIEFYRPKENKNSNNG